MNFRRPFIYKMHILQKKQINKKQEQKTNPPHLFIKPKSKNSVNLLNPYIYHHSFPSTGMDYVIFQRAWKLSLQWKLSSARKVWKVQNSSNNVKLIHCFG